MDEEACPVCLADYKADDKLRKLPCGHTIHQPVSVYNKIDVSFIDRRTLSCNCEKNICGTQLADWSMQLLLL